MYVPNAFVSYAQSDVRLRRNEIRPTALSTGRLRAGAIVRRLPPSTGYDRATISSVINFLLIPLRGLCTVIAVPESRRIVALSYNIRD